MADPMPPPQHALPSSMDEIEHLVKTLSDPGNAKNITEADAAFKILQRSPQGWEIGDKLLTSNDENIRFFGALTLTVKLNADSSDLDADQSRELLFKLIHHLVSRPASSVATRKLCSTLAQYSCSPISEWTQCIRCLVVSFALQQPVLDDALDTHPSTMQLLPQLSDEQLLVLLEFAMNLPEEAKKPFVVPPSPLASLKPQEIMVTNIESIETLLQVSFSRGIQYLSNPSSDPNQMGDKVCASSLKCFIGWIFNAHTGFQGVPAKLRYLRSVIELALACLEYHVDDAMELFADVLERYPSFFEPHHYRVLWSAITGPWGTEILREQDAETVSLARIIAGYGVYLVDEGRRFYRDPDNPHHQEVMTFLHHLLQYPEPVGLEDDVAEAALDFWSFYVNTISEESFDHATEKPDWLVKASEHVLLGVSELIQKMTYPSANTTTTPYPQWDDEAKRTFIGFREDARDIIQEAYNVLGNSIMDRLVQFTISAFGASDWEKLEAGLFCLISVSEFSHTAHPQLQQLFDQPIFTTISTNADIPEFVRRRAVQAVAAFDSFFLQHPVYLPQVLTFLFSALAQPTLANNAAKSFARLCSECRQSLTLELGSFFQMYEKFCGYETARRVTKSSVLEGIAAIVQAQGSDEQRLAGAQRLFDYVAQDARQAVNSTKQGDDAITGMNLALTTLMCLGAIGKAFGATDSDVVDLTHSEENPDQTSTKFWTHGPGKEIQYQIINFVNFLSQIFHAESQIIEEACNVLRVGFKEAGRSGPFVLPPSAPIDYIVKANLHTKRLTYVLDTATSWISAYKNDKSAECRVQSERLLGHVVSLMQSLQHPRNDPEIAVGCIELMQKFINTNAQIYVTVQPEVLKGMFDFSIECIKSPEVLPKRAAAQLWADIFDLSGNTQNPNQTTAQEIVSHFGPAVTFALMYNVCGEVDGSSLEHILVPLRRCINNDRNARTNITNALAGQELIMRLKDDSDMQGTIRRFIESLMRMAKNSNAFKETAKQFWTRCKQLQMQFAPHQMQPGYRFVHGPQPAGSLPF